MSSESPRQASNLVKAQALPTRFPHLLPRDGCTPPPQAYAVAKPRDVGALQRELLLAGPVEVAFYVPRRGLLRLHELQEQLRNRPQDLNIFLTGSDSRQTELLH
eukprot:s871_g16.t1